MTNDNLTDGERLKRIESQFEQLLQVVSIQYEAGDTKTATLARIAKNQANIGNQLGGHMHTIERRFDSLERDIAEIRKHDVEPLRNDVSDHKKRLKGNGTDGIERTVETLKKSYDSWVKWRSVILTALVVAVVGNTFVLVWSRVTAPAPVQQQKTLAEQLKDPAVIDELRKLFAPQQSAAEPKPDPEKPRSTRRRRPMPVIPGPGAQIPEIANDNQSRLASNRATIAGPRFQTLKGRSN